MDERPPRSLATNMPTSSIEPVAQRGKHTGDAVAEGRAAATGKQQTARPKAGGPLPNHRAGIAASAEVAAAGANRELIAEMAYATTAIVDVHRHIDCGDPALS